MEENYENRLLAAFESIAESLKMIADKPPLQMSIERVNEMIEDEAREALQ